MRKIFIFLLLGVIFSLLIVYNNQLFFYFQKQRLKKHITTLSPVYKTNTFSDKVNFCNIQPYSKIWAHRVNTLERFKFLASHFQGFEIDIVFDETKNVFDVRHPPATSINLLFETYLQTAEGKDKLFWIDLKNLTNGNEGAILSALKMLDEQYKIHKRIIVESNNIIQLSKIAEAGFFTSYYYDWDSYFEFVSGRNKRFTDSVFDKINAVSQDVLMYDTLIARFPYKPRLTWALSIKNYFSDGLFTALDKDGGLLVYLVNVKSPHYR